MASPTCRTANVVLEFACVFKLGYPRGALLKPMGIGMGALAGACMCIGICIVAKGLAGGCATLAVVGINDAASEPALALDLAVGAAAVGANDDSYGDGDANGSTGSAV